MTHLANLSPSRLVQGAEGAVSIHTWSSGSKSVQEPNITFSCLREVIPQVSQRYFGEGGAFISYILPHWWK